MRQRRGWVAGGLSLLVLGATPVWARSPEASPGQQPRLADAASKEAIKRVRRDFDIVMVELDEHDFPEANDFIDRAADSVEANREYLGSEEEYTRFRVLLTQAREAIKKKQFLPARRAVSEIMALLGKLQATRPVGAA